MENHWSVTAGQSVHKKNLLLGYKPENLHVSIFGTFLSISANIMHYQ